MVRLNPAEMQCLEKLEQRAGYLQERIAACRGQQRQFYQREHKALTWVLEVLGHAQATNCEAAFAVTQLRQGGPQNSELYFRARARRLYEQYRRQQQQAA